MFLLSFVALAIAIGYLQGGRINRTVHIDLKASYLIWCALGLQIGLLALGTAMKDVVATYGLLAHLAAYLLVVAFLLVNWKIRGLHLISAGLICNLFAIMSSNGYMPELPIAASGINMDTNSLLEMFRTKPLWFLSDIFPTPGIMGGDPFSVGDLLIGVGLFIGTRSVLFTWSARPIFQAKSRYQPKHLNDAQPKEEYSDIAS